MKQKFKISILTIILLNILISGFGQHSLDKKQKLQLTIAAIDKICNSIDTKKNLYEYIREGENIDGKGGFETYALKDKIKKRILRIENSISTDRKYCKNVFYFKLDKLIKAVVGNTITNEDNSIKRYLTTYYFNNNKLIKQIGENTNYQAILKQSLEFQNQFIN